MADTYILAGDMGLAGGLAYGSMRRGLIASKAIDVKKARRRHGVAGALKVSNSITERFLRKASLIKPRDNLVLVYEEPTMNSRRGNLLQYGFIAGLLTITEYKQVLSIYPTSLKKFATGSGRADKDDMIDAANSWSGLDLEDHNVADAILMLKWGIEQLKNKN